MPYRALEVANYFLDLAKRDKKTISPMKLQKLVFFAHGWNLALRNDPLLLERVEAWDYGPVIPAIYHEFKEFGRDGITRPARSYRIEGSKIFSSEYQLDADDDTYALLEKIWEVYGKYSAIQLSNATHATGGAWYKAYHEGGGIERRGTDIDDKLIEEEFIAKAEQSQRAQEANGLEPGEGGAEPQRHP